MTDTDFRNELTAGLDALAQTITVAQPDPARVKPPAGSRPPTEPSAHGRLLLVAACLAVAVAAAGAVAWMATGSGGGEGSVDPTRGEEAAGVEVILWLDVDIDAGTLDQLRAAVGDDARIDSATYIDREATYQEFLRYFADEPELTALVQPEQLPTSFRLLVPADLVDEITGWAVVQPGVVDVERSGDLPDEVDELEAEAAGERAMINKLQIQQQNVSAERSALRRAITETEQPDPTMTARLADLSEEIQVLEGRIQRHQARLFELEHKLETTTGS